MSACKYDTDYVHIGREDIIKAPFGLDDPNISQEDKDLRLAIALQQEENARALATSKRKIENAEKANVMRTGRSGVHSRLAAVRDKDHGMLSVPSDSVGTYQAPGSYVNSSKGLSQEVADHNLALELQKLENSSAGTSQAADKLTSAEKEIQEAQENRTARSGKQAVCEFIQRFIPRGCRS